MDLGRLARHALPALPGLILLVMTGATRYIMGPALAVINALYLSFVRLLDPGGDLVGIAEPTGVAGLLHPFVVLG